MKKYLLSAIFVLMLVFGSASAASLFPVDRTSVDGVTAWGYMDDTGRQVLPFDYASASAFNEQGLAVVGDRKGQVAVIDQTGALVIPYQAGTADMFTFSGDQIVFRYGDEATRVYATDGTLLGAFGRTAGLLRDGLIAAADETGLWGYAAADGTMVIPAQYLSAGGFVNGRAIARKAENLYVVLDLNRTGSEPADEPAPFFTETALPEGAAPVYSEIYEDDLVILTDGTRSALYSLSRASYVTDYVYQAIMPFHEGYTMMRVNNRWGIMNAAGRTTVDFIYNYLSYMGGGVYAARGADGYVTAIDANGNLIYRTYLYVGGFETITHGVSWHGTDDGQVIFFSKVGGYITRFENAEQPTVLTSDVAVLGLDGKRQYVRLSDGKTLYTPSRTYQLGELTIDTVQYEKYLGTDDDGTEYGWRLSYPQVSGLADETVQQKVNAAIETFFLEGPSFSARSMPLSGGYGAALEGSVLIVWADCVSGLGEGATVWNDNVALDLTTGDSYRVVRDLFARDYLNVLSPLLPADIPYYLCSYPRVTDSGVSFYLSTAATATAPASVREIALDYSDIEAAIDKDGAFWNALCTPLPSQSKVSQADKSSVYTGYADVAQSHWAYDSIKTVSLAGLMRGDGTYFAPAREITAAEAAATLVRALGLDTTPAGADQPWYAAELAAARKAGLLDGFTGTLDLTASIPRADVMQLLSNALLARGGIRALTTAQTDVVLALYRDSASLPANRRGAAALCIQKGLITGSNGALRPNDSMTRAEFARVLEVLIADGD